MNVMILAAGEGTRLRPFTLELPKPAIPFLGAPLASYSLGLLDGIQIDNLVVNTHHLPDKVEKLFLDLKPECKRLAFTHEPELLGSGGGIHNAKKHLDGRGDFIIMNGDEVILPHNMKMMDEMISFHRWHKGLATLLTMKHPEVGTKFGGAWLSAGSSKINCFSKTNPGGTSTEGRHFLGVMVLSDRVFKYFKPQVEVENILYETLTQGIFQGEEVHSFEVQTEWFETGNPVDFMSATETCLNSLNSTPENSRQYWQEYLLQQVRLNSQQRAFIEKGTPTEQTLRDFISKQKS